MIAKNNRWWGFLLGFFVSVGLLTSLSMEAAETVIRCQLPDGRVSYSDRSCRAGIQDELEIDNQQIGWEAPRTPLKLEHKSKRERKQQSRRQAAALRVARKEKARTKKDCWKKKQKVARIQERLRRGYKAGQGRTMRYKQRELEDYLREFCK